MSVETAALDDCERSLLRRAAEWDPQITLSNLTPERISELTRKQGVDFATAVLYDRICQSDRHGAFIRRIDLLRRSTSRRPRFDDVTFAVAPGAFWRESPHVDADGRMLRGVAAEFHCRSELIPVPSTGRLRDNAAIILRWLRKQRSRVILASASKGSADVRLALREDPGAFENVIAWLSVSGMMHGTPLVEHLLSRRLRCAFVRMLFWWRGFDFGMVHDLRPDGDCLSKGNPELPPHLRLVSVLGFPLEMHMRHRRPRMWRRALAAQGPSDGGILLFDVLRLPGALYPIWGADHYLQPANFDPHEFARALFAWLHEELEPAATNRRHSLTMELT